MFLSNKAIILDMSLRKLALQNDFLIWSCCQMLKKFCLSTIVLKNASVQLMKMSLPFAPETDRVSKDIWRKNHAQMQNLFLGTN